MIIGMHFEENTCRKCSYEENRIIEHEPFFMENSWEYYVKEELKKNNDIFDIFIGVLFDKVSSEEVQILEGLRKIYHLSRKQLRIFTKEEAFIGLMEKESKWLEKGNAGLFDYTSKGLFYYLVQKKGNQLTIQKVDVTNYMELSNREEEKDIPFLSAIKNVMAKGVTSVVYLCGTGFDGDWMKESVKVLCSGSKVFMGKHIFAQGMISSYLAEKEDVYQSVIMTQNGTRYHVNLYVYQGERRVVYPLLKEGTSWMASKNEVTVIGKGTTKLRLQIENAKSKEKTDIKIPLTTTPREVTKYRIATEYISESQIKIKVYDLGFGAVFPKKYKVVQQIISLEEVMNFYE